MPRLRDNPIKEMPDKLPQIFRLVSQVDSAAVTEVGKYNRATSRCARWLNRAVIFDYLFLIHRVMTLPRKYGRDPRFHALLTVANILTLSSIKT